MISGLEGRGGLFSEGRKVLPHSIGRQLGSRTLLSTAPEDGRLRGGSLTCLHQDPDHGLGGGRRALKNLCCGSLKRDPHGPFYIILRALNCYDFGNNDPASLAFARMPRAEARGGMAARDRGVARRVKSGSFTQSAFSEKNPSWQSSLEQRQMPRE